MQLGYAIIAILDQYLASSRAVNAATATCDGHNCAEHQSEATYHPISITPAAGRAARRGATLQHDIVDCVGIGRPMLCSCWRDIEESML